MGAPSDPSAAEVPPGAPPATYAPPPPVAYPPPPTGPPPVYPPPPTGYIGATPATGYPTPPPGTHTTIYVASTVAPGAFSSTPFPGLKTERPLVRPAPGQVIVGYEAGEGEPGCCKCDTLTPMGWIFVILWVIIFWPLAFIVCLLPGMHELVQRPVYRNPAMAQPAPGPPGGTTIVV